MTEAAPTTIAATLANAVSSLCAAGIEQPRLDARLLLQRASGLTREAILTAPKATLPADALAAYTRLLARRCRREPVSHLLGEREFWSLPFTVGRAVLDPRPDSETLIAAMLAEAPDQLTELTILDLGTGSGCLLLALLSELPNAHGVGVDLSPAAIRIAQTNATALGLDHRTDFVVGDWAAMMAGPFDWVICNPPYVVDGDIAGLSTEVRCFEPRLALAGGVDGLDAYRRVLPDVKRIIGRDGILGLEVGSGQMTAVRALLRDCGISGYRVHKDLSGVDRCVLARLETEN